MKIILSPAKTISKTCERFSSGVEFSNWFQKIIARLFICMMECVIKI